MPLTSPETTDLDYFKYANGDVDVFRRTTRGWELWVLVRESVAIPRGGKGLFAGRAFSKGDRIGRYVGRILGKARDPKLMDVTYTVEGDAIIDLGGYLIDGRRKVQSNDIQKEKFGKVVLKQPEWSWPGAYVHLANDARGSGHKNNARITPKGHMELTRRLPAYDASKPHAQNVSSEILWSYGRDYWRNTAKLGTASMPYVVE